MTIVGDGEQRRDFTHVYDVVEANILASQFVSPKHNYPRTWGQVYNIGTGVNYSINQIADMIGENKLHIEARTGEARNTLSDSSKAMRDFGWKPKISFESWIAENK